MDDNVLAEGLSEIRQTLLETVNDVLACRKGFFEECDDAATTFKELDPLEMKKSVEGMTNRIVDGHLRISGILERLIGMLGRS